jgi:hypothetical protein
VRDVTLRVDFRFGFMVKFLISAAVSRSDVDLRERAAILTLTGISEAYIFGLVGCSCAKIVTCPATSLALSDTVNGSGSEPGNVRLSQISPDLTVMFEAMSGILVQDDAESAQLIVQILSPQYIRKSMLSEFVHSACPVRILYSICI